jgi:hypothetical protein
MLDDTKIEKCERSQCFTGGLRFLPQIEIVDKNEEKHV